MYLVSVVFHTLHEFNVVCVNNYSDKVALVARTSVVLKALSECVLNTTVIELGANKHT